MQNIIILVIMFMGVIFMIGIAGSLGFIPVFYIDLLPRIRKKNNKDIKLFRAYQRHKKRNIAILLAAFFLFGAPWVLLTSYYDLNHGNKNFWLTVQDYMKVVRPALKTKHKFYDAVQKATDPLIPQAARNVIEPLYEHTADVANNAVQKTFVPEPKKGFIGRIGGFFTGIFGFIGKGIGVLL